jgi:hypothetical protein
MSSVPLNRAEAFVLGVCQRSFLSLWCYNNPRAKAGKELCDILVVCDPDVIIVSVKEILLNEEKDPAVAHARWERKAVEASVNQIYGAARWLSTAAHVIRNDGTSGLTLPPPDIRRVHRIAVALGDREQAMIKSGDFGQGFVHVMTEQSFREVLTELDTITDLTDYLIAKEAFAKSGTAIICEGSESNMLGWYLSRERTFPLGQQVVCFDETIWPGLQNNAAFKRRKEADRASYVWDKLTEGLSDPNAKPIAGPGPELNKLELALRTMARETRFNRRSLGMFVGDFLLAARANKLRSRIFCGPSGIIYVLIYFSPNEAPEMRSNELLGRLYVARHLTGQGTVIVGIGLSNHVPGVGAASDLIYARFPAWTTDDEAIAIKLKNESGYFSGTQIQHHCTDEYPEAQ